MSDFETVAFNSTTDERHETNTCRPCWSGSAAATWVVAGASTGKDLKSGAAFAGNVRECVVRPGILLRPESGVLWVFLAAFNCRQKSSTFAIRTMINTAVGYASQRWHKNRGSAQVWLSALRSCGCAAAPADPQAGGTTPLSLHTLAAVQFSS